jgi:prevent-host-death family protein
MITAVSAVTVHQAKTHLSRLLRRVAAGEEVTILRAGTPVARLVPVKPRKDARRLGLDRGKVLIADDFEAPLPEEILSSFET